MNINKKPSKQNQNEKQKHKKILIHGMIIIMIKKKYNLEYTVYCIFHIQTIKIIND